LKIVRGEFGDGREWATQVRECLTGETADMIGYDLSQVMALGGVDVIDILKVDIEGSEKVVFGHPEASWISRLRTVVIELHSPEDRAAVEAALPAATFARRSFGELTAFLRRESHSRV
jgi:hypothetical protein